MIGLSVRPTTGLDDNTFVINRSIGNIIGAHKSGRTVSMKLQTKTPLISRSHQFTDQQAIETVKNVTIISAFLQSNDTMNAEIIYNR